MKLFHPLPAALTVLVLAAGGLTVGAATAAAPAAASTPAAAGAYVPLSTPTRMLDTRTSIGGHKGAVKAHETVPLAISSAQGAVGPGTASAVALNVTVTGVTAPAVITVYPVGGQLPTASNLNVGPRQTLANMAIAKLGTDGRINIYNGSAGTDQIIVDVLGYYRAGTPADAGSFTSLAPARLLDTRTTVGDHRTPVKAHETLTLQLPSSGAGSLAIAASVAVNVTVTNTARSGVITAYPTGSPLPTASNLNYRAGQTVANMAVVRVGDSGRISFYNSSTGTVNLVVDVAGSFSAGAPLRAGTFGALSPLRLLDTRTTNGGHHSVVPAGGHVDLAVLGRGGVPVSGVSAVVLNVTATGGTRSGFVTVYPTGATAPGASTLNYGTGQTVSNLVEARVGTGGKVTLVNHSTGTVDLVADVAGYYLTADLPLPPTTHGHYLRNVRADSPDAALHNQGCEDAGTLTGSTPHTIVLDIGAQTNNKSDPNVAGKAGVRLTGDTEDDPNRMTDGRLVTFVEGYLGGLTACRASSATGKVTIAVATNSDGDFTGYTAQAKGKEWANVVNMLATAAGTAVTVVGANDIEPSYAATQADVEQWEIAYLAATKAGLLFIGSAGGCPIPLGQTGGTCAVADNPANRWSQAEIYRMAHGLNKERITALPQVYDADEAAQWANIDRTGATATDHISFLGALTEHAADPVDSVTPDQGWALLHQSLSAAAYTARGALPQVVDLDVI